MNLVYFAPVFPKITEPLIVEEVEELARKDSINLVVISEGMEDYEIPDAVRGRITTFTPATASIVKANLSLLARHPLRYIKAFLLFVWSDHVTVNGFAYDVRDFFRGAALAGFARLFAPDYLYTNGLDAKASLIMAAGLILNVPFGFHVTAKDLIIPSSNNIYLLPTMRKRKLGASKFIRTALEYSKNYLIQNNPALSDKIHIVRQGVNVRKYPGADLAYPKDADALNILQVGRMTKEKGFEYTLEACKILRERNVKFVCDFVGDAKLDQSSLDYKDQLQKLIIRYGLMENVNFLGLLNSHDLIIKLKETHIVVIPYVSYEDTKVVEELPPIALSAFAAKRLVIAFKHHGVSEIINEKNGFVVSEKDVSGLVEKLIWINENKESASKMGESGRELVNKKFNTANNVSEFIALLNKES